MNVWGKKIYGTYKIKLEKILKDPETTQEHEPHASLMPGGSEAECVYMDPDTTLEIVVESPTKKK